jgi:hypothetical protein
MPFAQHFEPTLSVPDRRGWDFVPPCFAFERLNPAWGQVAGPNTNRVASRGNRSQVSTRSGRKRQTPFSA